MNKLTPWIMLVTIIYLPTGAPDYEAINRQLESEYEQQLENEYNEPQRQQFNNEIFYSLFSSDLF